MSDLLYARWLMGLSLAFHIVFAAVGVAMPLFMTLAEWRWRRTGEPVYLELARRWAKGTAILFAVGAVSGTVISFELGLLWPGFMQFSGALIGMPFSLEGFAFFTEAIFLGIFLYGWERVSPFLHLASGAIVALSGAASAFFVTLANAWMNVRTCSCPATWRPRSWSRASTPSICCATETAAFTGRRSASPSPWVASPRSSK
jgi:cytochrome d ubiquinol oxidase subunit I